MKKQLHFSTFNMKRNISGNANYTKEQNPSIMAQVDFRYSSIIFLHTIDAVDFSLMLNAFNIKLEMACILF